MAHSLIPERMLVVSPNLAATIGLDEAIMLQALHDGARSHDADWQVFNKNDLRNWLPFWQDQDIKRILKSLTDKGIVHFNSPPFGQSEQLFFSFDNKAPASHRQSKTQVAYKESQQQFKNAIPNQWQPDSETLKYIDETLGIARRYAKLQVRDFVFHYQSQGTLAASWSTMFIRWVNKRNKDDQNNPAIFKGDAARRQNMEQNWQPQAATLEILHKAGVEQNFMRDCVGEFVLYWMEKGVAHDTWNTKFVAWVRRQWARFSASLAHPTDPIPMQEGWQPAEDVYDILAMANIDRAFAVSLVQEFILYWRDSKQLHTSWNVKFLQHAKHHWSKRLNGQNSAATSQRDYAANTSIAERVKDLSWADGL
ncbi:MAG: DnaT-like ssDNA-binding domain-containing protein [Bermanella sp.]